MKANEITEPTKVIVYAYADMTGGMAEGYRQYVTECALIAAQEGAADSEFFFDLNDPSWIFWFGVGVPACRAVEIRFGVNFGGIHNA